MRQFQRQALIPREGTPILFHEFDTMPGQGGEDAAFRQRESHIWDFFPCGIHVQEAAQRWAINMKETLVELGIAGERLGIDRLNFSGFDAAINQGIKLADGRVPLERARSITPTDIMDPSTSAMRLEGKGRKERIFSIPALTPS